MASRARLGAEEAPASPATPPPAVFGQWSPIPAPDILDRPAWPAGRLPSCPWPWGLLQPAVAGIAEGSAADPGVVAVAAATDLPAIIANNEHQHAHLRQRLDL